MGIGGAGMSALARYFAFRGVEVSGSDENPSEILSELAAEKMNIFVGHDAKNVPPDIFELVFSAAIPPENPERKFAAEKNIPQKSYFAALGDLSRTKKTIAICGTHGKSTTTAMAGLALETVADPLVILGARVFEWKNQNIRLPVADFSRKGDADFLVVESCEFQNSFLNLSPDILVLTNCEPDHLDFFKTPENYFAAFQKFAEKLPKNGILIADFSDPTISKLFSKIAVKKIDASKFLEKVDFLNLPGAHNRQNAARVAALFDALGFDFSAAKSALKNFRGIARRFEKKGEKNGILVFDDYAHHPTEIRASLAAFAEKFPKKRRVVVFQPHQFSRTRDFFAEFSKSFSAADRVFIPNIFAARDAEIDENLAEKLAEKIGKKATHSENFEKTLALLRAELRAGDALITMGAGDVFRIGERFLSDEKEF